MSYFTRPMMYRDVPPDWLRRVERLWSQDDAVPDEDTVSLAWRRLFGGDLPGREAWIAMSDGGDHETMVDAFGRVFTSSYPGANELGVLRGSPIDVHPRLVISGGQTGADRGALAAALAEGWPIGGWAPRGFRAEDGQIPEPFRGHLWESDSAGYAARTRDNVDAADGTLLVSLTSELTGGSLMTWDYAGRVRRRRYHAIVTPDLERGAALIAHWLVELRIGVLNVAGPRESRQPGIGDAVRDLLVRALRIVDDAARSRSPSPVPAKAAAPELQSPDLEVPIPDDASSSVSTVDGPVRRKSAATTWSPEQETVMRQVRDWMTSPFAPQVFYLAGVAGSGKSTLARELVAQSGEQWLFAAYTGKAALVMERKGCVGARTIHSTIYRPEGAGTVGEDGQHRPSFGIREDSPLRTSPGIVLDECSMIGDELGNDVLSFGKKVLVLGDPAQLPPIEGAGFFTRREPDAMLYEVHRQARDSGILDLATFVREGGDLFQRVGWRRDDCEVVSRERSEVAELMRRMVEADQVIVGRNDTRHRMNARYRQLCRISDDLPVAGEKVICLRNERKAGLFNGSMWVVRSSARTGPGTIDLEIETLDGISPGVLTSRTWIHHFLGREADLALMGPARTGFQEFDFAYFITAHKAQGSQWDDVVLYDESRIFRSDRNKWLYTGITRAAKRLLVVV